MVGYQENRPLDGEGEEEKKKVLADACSIADEWAFHGRTGLIGESGEILVFGDRVGVSVVSEEVVFAVPFDFNGGYIQSFDFQNVASSLIGEPVFDGFAPLFHVEVVEVRFCAGFRVADPHAAAGNPFGFGHGFHVVLVNIHHQVVGAEVFLVGSFGDQCVRRVQGGGICGERVCGDSGLFRAYGSFHDLHNGVCHSGFCVCPLETEHFKCGELVKEVESTG